jgi:hypothetical protein
MRSGTHRMQIFFGPYPNAFWDPLMRLVIPIRKILHNGLVLLISYMRTITKRIQLVTEPVPKCIQGSPYTFGDSYNPKMHMGIVNVLIPVCYYA